MKKRNHGNERLERVFCGNGWRAEPTKFRMNSCLPRTQIFWRHYSVLTVCWLPVDYSMSRQKSLYGTGRCVDPDVLLKVRRWCLVEGKLDERLIDKCNWSDDDVMMNGGSEVVAYSVIFMRISDGYGVFSGVGRNYFVNINPLHYLLLSIP